jgi:hypothetical protein
MRSVLFFFLGFSVFQVLPVKADVVGAGFYLYACIQEKKHTTTTQETQYQPENGVLKVFFLTQGITGEPKFCSALAFEMLLISSNHLLSRHSQNKFCSALAFEMVSRCVRDDIGEI